MKRIGTQLKLSESEREELLQELNTWKNNSSKYYTRREKAERMFLQEWKSAALTGLRQDTDEETAFPFDGASDQRVRWGDTAFQEMLSVIMIALDTCKIEVVCDGSAEGVKRAAAIKKLIKWCRRKLGQKWYMQIMALMRYLIVDTPAVAAMNVDWVKKTALAILELNFDTLQAEYVSWRTSDGKTSNTDAAVEFATNIKGDMAEIEPQVIEFLTRKGVKPKHVSKVIQALAEEGECEVAVVVPSWEGPEIKAMRYGDDFMISESCEDFDYADPFYIQEWYTEAQLREMAANEDWDRQWLEETIEETPGKAIYTDLSDNDLQDFQKMFNVVWFYKAETDAYGNTARYEILLSGAKGSAFGKRLIKNHRGKWDAIFFRREVLANNLTASRGIAEICAPDQGLAKQMKDGANNNAIVGGLPPLKAKGNRVRNVFIEPLNIISMGINDDLTWLNPPPYPAAAKEMIKELKDDLYAFLGISNGETDVSSRTQSFTSFMLAQFRELYVRLVEAAQDNASDEALLTVTSTNDLQGLRREDLNGDFQLSIEFNPANMNHKDLIERTSALSQLLLPMDSQNEFDRSPIIRNVMANLFPEMAETSFKSAEQLTQNDIKDEQQNFIKIKAGIMPQMDTEGKWNYQARLDFYRQLEQTNPAAIQEMSPTSQEIFNNWIQALEMQERQFGENARIGRTGVEGVSAK